MILKKFHIKAHFNHGFEVVEIQGKDLGDAFYRYFKMKSKQLRICTGFELVNKKDYE